MKNTCELREKDFGSPVVTKRRLLVAAICALGIGGVVEPKIIFPESIAQKLSHWMENADAAEETQDIFPRYAVETVWKRAVAIARPNDKSIVESIGLQIRTENYPYQQYMADAARQLFNEMGDPVYRNIAMHFYQQALSLAKGQEDGTYSPPPKQKGGTDHIEERIRYCKDKLSLLTSYKREVTQQ